MKKIFTLFIVLSLFVFAALPAFAVSSNAPAVTDEADLFSSSAEAALEEKILAIRADYGVDVGILTYRFNNEMYVSDDRAQYFCENYYNQAGFSDDGIVLMIFFESDDDGGTHMATAGKCIKVFNSSDLYNIEDNFYPYLSERNSEGYYNAALSFISDCEDQLYDYVNFNTKWFFIAPIIGAVFAFISVSVMKGKLKTVRSKANASGYTKNGSLKLNSSSDVFLYRRVTKTPRPKDTYSGSGGRSFHSGAGGRSFGGHSGRRF